MKYSQQNNIVTCERGHSYSFHTIQALEIKLGRDCEGCLMEDRPALSLDEQKKTLEDFNQALELLWAMCDEINAVPRHGNVFDRAREALAKLQAENGH